MENITERDRIKAEEEIQDIYDKFCIWYHDDGSYDNFHKSEAIKSINDYSNEKIEENAIRFVSWFYQNVNEDFKIIQHGEFGKSYTFKELYQQFKTKRDENKIHKI